MCGNIRLKRMQSLPAVSRTFHALPLDGAREFHVLNSSPSLKTYFVVKNAPRTWNRYPENL